MKPKPVEDMSYEAHRQMAGFLPSWIEVEQELAFADVFKGENDD